MVGSSRYCRRRCEGCHVSMTAGYSTVYSGGCGRAPRARTSEMITSSPQSSLHPYAFGRDIMSRWAKLGHAVRLMPPAYVKPYVKRGKTDANDAEAICEAVTRPTMRFVPVKSPEQQSALALHRTRDLLVKQRTQLVNMIRAACSRSLASRSCVGCITRSNWLRGSPTLVAAREGQSTSSAASTLSGNSASMNPNRVMSVIRCG